MNAGFLKLKETLTQLSNAAYRELKTLSKDHYALRAFVFVFF